MDLQMPLTSKVTGGGIYDQDCDILIRDYDYNNMKELCRGGYGTIYTIKNRHTNVVYALKKMKYKNASKQDTVIILRERAALTQIDNKYIIKLYAGFTSSTDIFLLLEYAPNKDFYYNMYADGSGKGALHISSVRYYSAQLTLALEYLRSVGFVHRDIKPENIVLDKDWNLKLTDFGCVKQIGDRQGSSMVLRAYATYTPIGSLSYVAPEVILAEFVTFSTDLWGLAMFIFELHCGVAFHGPKPQEAGQSRAEWRDKCREYYSVIGRGEQKWPEMTDLDTELKDLVTKLTNDNPERRLGSDNINEVKSHPFFSNIPWSNMDSLRSPGIVKIFTKKATAKETVVSKLQIAKQKSKAAAEEFQNMWKKLVSPPPPPEEDTDDSTQEDADVSSVSEGGGASASAPAQLDPGLDMLYTTFDLDNKELLGEGALGQVYKVAEKTTGKFYAMKQMEKIILLLEERTQVWVKRERIALNLIDSPFIIKLHSSYQDMERVYFVLEYAENGTLHDWIYEKSEGTGFDIACVQFFCAEVVMALVYLRSINYVHRDIKNDNVLFDSQWHMKLTDFGAAKTIDDVQGTTLKQSKMEAIKNSHAGAPAYLSPEVYFQDPVTYSTDLWALGFMVYEMYNGDKLPELTDTAALPDDPNIAERYYSFIDEECYEYFIKKPNPNLKKLVHRLTRTDPEIRLGADDLKDLQNAKFFRGIDWNNLIDTPSPGIIDNKEPRKRTVLVPKASEMRRRAKPAPARAPAPAPAPASTSRWRTASELRNIPLAQAINIFDDVRRVASPPPKK